MTPSECIAAGICPWCGGAGAVTSVLLDALILCRICNGTCTWPPPEEDPDAIQVTWEPKP